MKKIILVALAALALGLAAVEVGAPAVASIRSGPHGDFQAGVDAPASIAGGAAGGHSGEFRAEAPHISVDSVRSGGGGNFGH
jgi:hypothetical protein